MLFLQMTLVLSVAAQQAPWMARTVINKFVDGVKVGFSSFVFWVLGEGADMRWVGGVSVEADSE